MADFIMKQGMQEISGSTREELANYPGGTAKTPKMSRRNSSFRPIFGLFWDYLGENY